MFAPKYITLLLLIHNKLTWLEKCCPGSLHNNKFNNNSNFR